MIRLVVDTNIILSTLIRSRKKIKDILIKEKTFEICIPAYTYFKIINHYTTLSESV